MVVSACPVRRISARSDRLRVDRAVTSSRGRRRIGDRSIHGFAVSRRYAGECKQYAIDAALAVGDVRGLGWPAGRPGRDVAGGRSWPPSGAAAVWFSHPVAFVLGGIGTALFFLSLVGEGPPPVQACLASSPAGSRVSALCYSPASSNSVTTSSCSTTGRVTSCRCRRSPLGDLMWLADHFFGSSLTPAGLGERSEGWRDCRGFASIGLVALARERWPVAVALALPAFLRSSPRACTSTPSRGGCCSSLCRHAARGRAAGAWTVTVALRPTRPLAAIVLLGLLLLVPDDRDVPVASAIPSASEQIGPGAGGTSATRCSPAIASTSIRAACRRSLSTPATTPSPPAWSWESNTTRCTGLSRRPPKFAGEPRVWLIFSHPHQDEESLVQSYAEALGVRPAKDPSKSVRWRSCSTSGHRR